MPPETEAVEHLTQDDVLKRIATLELAETIARLCSDRRSTNTIETILMNPKRLLDVDPDDLIRKALAVVFGVLDLENADAIEIRAVANLVKTTAMILGHEI